MGTIYKYIAILISISTLVGGPLQKYADVPETVCKSVVQSGYNSGAKFADDEGSSSTGAAVTSMVTGAAATPTATPTATPYVLSDDEQDKVDEFEDARAEDLRCVVDTAKKVRLRWKRIKNADYYTIYRSEKKNGEYKKLDTTKKLRYIDRTAKGRRDYFYRVSAAWFFHEKLYSSAQGKKLKVYVMPKKPVTVVAGECFVQDFAMMSGFWPKNVHLVYKIGVNTYTMMHSNYFTEGGNSVTGIEKIATYHPDRVYFLIGANESAWQNPSWTMGNYGKMISLLRSQNKHVQIILIAVPPFASSSTENIPTPAKRDSYNSAYKNYAEKHSFAYFCPATYVLEDGSRHLLRSYDAGDGCHWNMTGASRVAGEIRAWSKKTFGNW